MVGVEFSQGGESQFASARIETVLAAGSIGSPQILQLSGIGAGELLLTSMDRDGTGKGFDIELTRAVADAVTVPVIAWGLGLDRMAMVALGIHDIRELFTDNLDLIRSTKGSF